MLAEQLLREQDVESLRALDLRFDQLLTSTDFHRGMCLYTLVLIGTNVLLWGITIMTLA